MLAKLFGRPRRLVLDIDGRRLTFVSLADFEFSLASRTEVPASKLEELMQLSSGDLLQEARKIREVEKRLVQVLAKALEEPHSVSHRMRELGDKLFTQDHGWRALAAALNRMDQSYGDYKKIALVKYLQYLGSRQDMLKSMYASRDRHDEGGVLDGGESDRPFKETVIFDLSVKEGPRMDTSRFERLPKGETVAIRLPDEGNLEMMLSRNRFWVATTPRLTLLDDTGANFPLVGGRNMIGRDSKSEIVIDSRYRDVSRSHLIIEPFSDDTALFTDLSSHGTYVPVKSIRLGS